MFPNPNIRSRGHVECDEVHGYYGEHVDLSSTTELVENPVLPQYVITSDNEWVHPLSEVGNEDEYQLHDLVNMRQQLDYTEGVFSRSNAQTYMETESNLYEIQQVVANEITIDDMLWNAVEPQQYVSAVHQDSSQQYPQLGVRQTRAPREIEAALGIYGMHHIAHNSSSELEIETNHSIQCDSRPVIMFEGPVHQSENALPAHHVQILRSKSKSQLCHLSHGESANRTIEPAIDLATDRCVASLDELCDPNFATTEHQRYVQRPTLHSHYEMADSTRKGGGLYNWTGDGRQHGARMLGTDRTPRFTTSSQATSSTSQSSPFSSGLIRPPLLTNVSGTEVMRRPHLLKGNAVNTTASAIGGYDHAYHRSRSSEHRGTSTSNYHQAMKIERQVARTVDAKSISGLDEGRCTSERFLDKNQEKRSSSSISKGVSQCSDKNNYSKNVQVTPGSNATFTSKPKKQYTTVRDEYGRLRRIKRFPDGTLYTRDSSQGNLISQMGRITAEKCVGAKGHTPRSPTAETVWDEQSVVAKYGKIGGKRTGQWTGSQAYLTSSNPSASISECEGAYQNQNSRCFDAKTQPKTKGKRSDLLHPNAAKRQKHSRRSVLLDRDRAVTTGKGVQGSARIIDVEAIDDIEAKTTSELVASESPSECSNSSEQCIKEPRKVGRPLKKFRGRLAKQRQAIRDAEISEKAAIKQRELPVLDLILKSVEDPTTELPLELATFVDSSVIHDTSLFHEVGEAMKDLVMQISLEGLQPKRAIKSRSRRNWEHLSKRVCSKRQDYRKLNTPVDQRSPPPPPLGYKPRGRNSEKYRQAMLERDRQQSGERANSNIPVLGPTPLWEYEPLNTSQEGIAETRNDGTENVSRCYIYEQSPSLPSKSQSGCAASCGSG